MKRCSCLILAAGASRRMGQPKQLLQLNGESLIERVIRIAEGANFDEVIVVLGANADQVLPVVDANKIRVLVNSDWAEGIGSTIRYGIQNVGRTDAVMIMLVDQPDVSSEWLLKLREKFDQSGCLAATTLSDGISSPPVIIDQRLFPRLLELSGDQGAKKILSQVHVEGLEFPGPLRDLDTPEDLESTA